MKPADESRNWSISTLLTQRAILVLLVVSLALLIILSYHTTVNGSESLHLALSNIAAVVLGSSVVGLTWEYASKKALGTELLGILHEEVRVIREDAVVATSARRLGVLDITRDFNSLPWAEYIASATTIDLYWWAGRGWFKQNADALKKRCQVDGSINVRLIVPDVDNPGLLAQMARDSDMEPDVLRNASREAMDLARRILGEGVKVYKSPYVPRYSFVRVGDLIAVSSYSNYPDLNMQRPTIVCTATEAIGQSAIGEFTSVVEASTQWISTHLDECDPAAV